MKNRSIKKLVALAALGTVSVFVMANTTFAAETIVLKMHQFLPAQATVPSKILYVWADKIEKDSGGRIKIDRYPSMQLGGRPPALIDQVVDGVVDIVWTVAGYTPGRFVRTEVFELPFMSYNAEATSRAYWEMIDKDMKDKEFKDVHILGGWVHGAGILHSQKPINKLEDMKGLKIRGGTRANNMLLTELQSIPIGMPVPGVPEALSKGVINATTIPWEVAAPLKVAELVKNHTEFTGKALYTLPFIFVMNKEKYNSLPDDLKKVIDDNSGLEFSANAGRIMEEADGPVREKAKQAGNNIIVLDAEETARWQKSSEAVYKTWSEFMESKGFDAKALIENAQNLIEKHTKK